jgi:hypothetical protein
VTIQRLPRLLAAAAFVCGVAAWIRFLDNGLVLSHYDAKAHLVVARRVLDSLTPGWQQIGAVWLPLPHLIQILPTQIDLFYRTGIFGSLVSIASFTVMVWAVARLIILVTGSAVAALAAGTMLIVNPNLLYLQSTPMTEPLLIAVVFIVLLWTYEWMNEIRPAGVSAEASAEAEAGLHPPSPRLKCALFAAMWTRYEAWPIVAAVLAAVAFALLRKGVGAHRTLALAVRLAAWPAAAVVLFALNSRISTGQWFVTGGFYEVDPTYDGLVGKSLIAVWWGTHRLTGYVVEIVALGGAGWLLAQAFRRPSAGSNLILLTPIAAAALPFYAFVEGHPFRVRYMVVLAAGALLLNGVAVGLLRQRAAAVMATGALIAASLVESPPLSLGAPMIEEAQWDVPRAIERQAVTACLRGRYQGERILASMGSLAHYMQELSHADIRIADFIHEGNGELWLLALTSGPAPHAGWMIVEEQSEGGDILAQRLREDAGFAHGLDRVCAGGGVALYRAR